MPAMTTLTFDTLDATRRLRDAGFNENQAEIVVRVLSDSQERLVTLEHFDSKLQIELAPIRTDLAVLKWMAGAGLGIGITILFKLFH